MANKMRQAYLMGLKGEGGPYYADSLKSHSERVAYWQGDADSLKDVCLHRWVWDSYGDMQSDGNAHCEICGDPRSRLNDDPDSPAGQEA